MNILDRIDNKVSNIRSKWNEDFDVDLINKQIQEEKDAIDIKISKIGEFYWNLYAKNEINVPKNIADVFEEIEKHVVKIKDLKIQIEKRKIAGTEERIQFDILIKEKEEKRAIKKAERKKFRENEHLKEKVVEENISEQAKK